MAFSTGRFYHIEKIMDLRKRENKDWWYLLADNEKESIEEGLQDADSGKLNSHLNARKLYEKWL